ncbi:hypothetical protein [Lentilactobacillus sp. SPB1-3]|uniref:Uncharacterized protein n=1 Tax=Lentilactobacillus terminaliae TaxID=3003483 RepID=A0ACD5DD19_9LACO|nr:hypothetical protein [Lentilactobacillus sp. SPB1-3]MCZ0978147.1 hypothetical protein [Lentilactobacillus sp. SPB1-3]
MFKTKNNKKNQIKFLNSLDYWESLNLATVLLIPNHKNAEDAYSEALTIVLDRNKMIDLLDKSIHSKLV